MEGVWSLARSKKIFRERKIKTVYEVYKDRAKSSSFLFYTDALIAKILGV
jgi:hypothetical protein